MMKRREFIKVLGGAAAWPLAARAQQSSAPAIGFVSINSPTEWAPFAAAFADGLGEVGFVEGRNVEVEYRWAEGHIERASAYVTEMVRRRVAVIVGANADVAVLAKAATATIPVVAIVGGDPVQLGLVLSLSRPGGNVTGVNFLSDELVAKRLGLLRDLLPGAKVFALLVNPGRSSGRVQADDVQKAARSVGVEISILTASTESEIDTAISGLDRQRSDALVVAADPFFLERRNQIIALAARRALPAIYSVREWTAAGGLMSYSTNLSDAYRQVGNYAGRILKGEKPADLPVQQSTRVELVINLKTAKALGITVPPSLLAIADEVIE